MDSLNTILNSGTYGDSVSRHNDNNSKIKQAITTLENVAIANKGYFDTLASLQAAFPSPKAGNIAYVANVASSTGYYIYNVVSGVWTATSTEAPAVGVAISNYAQHGYSSSPKTLKQVDDEVVQLAGEVLMRAKGSVTQLQLINETNIAPAMEQGWLDTVTIITTSATLYRIIYPVQEGDRFMFDIDYQSVSGGYRYAFTKGRETQTSYDIPPVSFVSQRNVIVNAPFDGYLQFNVKRDATTPYVKLYKYDAVDNKSELIDVDERQVYAAPNPDYLREYLKLAQDGLSLDINQKYVVKSGLRNIPLQVKKISDYIFNFEGYIGRLNGLLSGNNAYSSTDFQLIENFIEMLVSPTPSQTACSVAFYDSSKTFIGADLYLQQKITVPVGTAYFRACRLLSDSAYNYDYKLYGVLPTQNMSNYIEETSTVESYNGYWILKPLENKIRNSEIIDRIVSAKTTITGTSGVKQYQYSDTYLENFEFTCSIIPTTDISVSVGKGDSKVKLDNTSLYFYNFNGNLIETVALPFTFKTGEKIGIGFNKKRDSVKYTIVSQGVAYEKEYLKDANYDRALMWGAPFFSLESGTADILNITASSNYNPKSKLLIAGDSFIEGNSLLPTYTLDSKWSALVASIIGSYDVVIDGKGGELINQGFIRRIKRNLDLFMPKHFIISLGTNNNVVANYKTYMQALIDYVKNIGIIPILVTVTPRPDFDYNTITAEINNWVRATGELYVDMHKAVTKSDNPSVWKDGYVMADGVHPTPTGHTAMLNQIKIDCPFLLQL